MCHHRISLSKSMIEGRGQKYSKNLKKLLILFPSTPGTPTNPTNRNLTLLLKLLPAFQQLLVF